MKNLLEGMVLCAVPMFCQNSYAQNLPPLSANVFIEAQFLSDEPVICGITNLPDGVTLSISAQKETGTTHMAGEKVIVRESKFCTPPLRDYTAAATLEPGTYKVDIFMLPPDENEPGYELIGSRGKNLRGPLVSVMPDPEVPEGEVRTVDDQFTAQFGKGRDVIESNKVTKSQASRSNQANSPDSDNEFYFVGAFSSQEEAEQAVKQEKSKSRGGTSGKTYSIMSISYNGTTDYIVRSLEQRNKSTTRSSDPDALGFVVILGIILGGTYGVFKLASGGTPKPDLLTDAGRPERERRTELVKSLIRQGYVIQRQEPGLVVAVKPKPNFSMTYFIFLCLIWLIPGIIYLIWHATKRDEVKQFVLT